MERVILVGLSGSGKSSIARELAGRLGYECIDVDDEIVTRFGASIPEIFARYGEPAFRALERECLMRACSQPNRVIATGGGVVTDERNWLAMRPDNLIVHLTASPDEIIDRLRRQHASQPDARRPLLDAGDPRAALESLWHARKPLYNQADLTIDTTGKSPDRVIAELMDSINAANEGELPLPIASIGVPTGRSDLFVAPGLIQQSGTLARKRFPSAKRAWVITDTHVGPLWSSAVRQSFEGPEFSVDVIEVSAGEQSKSLECVSILLDWLLDGRLDRRDLVVALGGGVIGDLAGFVGAIALRGVGLVQIPTSLLAMVDSSVGGKTGVNHARGKNLIGAFYQPQLVLADPLTLATLPEREWRGGWAEIVKHAMIESTATQRIDAMLLETIERASDQELRDPVFMAGIVRRNVLIKSGVVQADERETGLRRILNYGHTLGHAMEASGYRYHHGEAIALGMRAAMDIALRAGRSNESVVARQNNVLDRIGLPVSFEGKLADVIDRLGSDKKAVHGRLTWILPGPYAGSVDIVDDVPMELVETAAIALGAER